jgi:hypothetical protein
MSDETHGHEAHGEGHGHGHDDHAPPPPGAERNMWPWVLGAGLGWMALFGGTWWLASFW